MFETSANDGALGICLGRDVVMRLGDDAVTPDLLVTTPERFSQLHATYFERINGQIVIGDWRGTRNVLGLLLMTVGLDIAMRMLHPRT